MDIKSIMECDRRRTEKLLKLKLPNYYKKIGWGGFIISMIILIGTKFIDPDPEMLKEVLKKTSLVFLLMVVLSKEKIEDEFVGQIRAQSFSFAFLAGVFMTLFLPFFSWIILKLFKPDQAILENLGDFQILWVMLLLYLLFFNVSKKWY
jgi:hypothetical protein